MARNSLALLIALLSLALVPAMVGCVGQTAPLDLDTVAACPGESGPGLNGPVPCVWDSKVRGEHPGGSPVRWYLYANTCPVRTTQPSDKVECVGRPDWTGGVEGEGRTN